MKLMNFIGGEFLPPQQENYLPNYAPARGEIYSEVPASTHLDVEKAVSAAKWAFESWSRTSSRERARILRRISSLIESKLPELAQAESVDTGKPISLAKMVDIPRSAQNFEFFADSISQFSSESHFTQDVPYPGAINYTLRSPLGVVACISPWNLPLYLLTWKIAPALAMGNTVVAKPSELTPMTAYLLCQICNEAGLPPGVMNIVHGTGDAVGNSLIQHPEIRAVSFTGSTQTGSKIAQQAAPLFKKLSLEMGGKNPNLIFADCDLDEAVEQTLRAAFSNQGQICLCGSRIFVELPIYEEFKSKLIEKVAALKIGDPQTPATQQGALVSQAHFEKVLSYINLAQEEGGKVLVGGHPVKLKGENEKGWFISPTLIENLEIQCRTQQEEIFGPVATLTPFENENQGITWANQTRYGLSASVWTRDIHRAHRIANQLHSGMVWINTWMLRDLRTPFGGTKDSGLGREGGIEALKFFTEPKNVCIQMKA